MEQEIRPPSLKAVQLSIVVAILWIQNAVLEALRRLLFRRPGDPKSILIFKVGNIGDVICAIPAFVAIRRAYPQAKIVLLTSPGKRGAVGGKELLTGAKYLDDLRVYYSDDIDSANKRKTFIEALKREQYDLFIQIPDDYVRFRTLARNMIFAKLIGARSAFGFRVRTILNLFKNTQVDYSFEKCEVENILDVLNRYAPFGGKVKFDFPSSELTEEKIGKLLDYLGAGKRTIIVINVGAKREANAWPPERFGEVVKYLVDEYNAGIVFIGSADDAPRIAIAARQISESHSLILAGKLTLLETVSLVRKCDLLISNDTGAVHIAAAVATPVVGIYGVRNVFGKWFPYGIQHRIIYHRPIPCDYTKENCIAESVCSVTANEIEAACDDILKRNGSKTHE